MKTDLIASNVVLAEITQAFTRSTALATDEDLMSLSYSVENKTAAGVIERDAGKFPNGPIGARSELTVLYLDQDLKIGTAPNAYSGYNELFIMERQARPTR